jgi:hypothetical protein
MIMPAKTKTKTVKLKNLASATSASVQAAVGKQLGKSLKGGITAGIVLNDAEVARLAAKPMDLAKDITKQVRAQSGISVTPQVTTIPGGLIMGYQLPRIMKS